MEQDSHEECSGSRVGSSRQRGVFFCLFLEIIRAHGHDEPDR